MNISTAIQILDFFYEECTDEYLREYKYSLEDFVYEGYEGYEILGIFVANPEVYDILEENDYEIVYYIKSPTGYVFIGILANRRIFDVTYSVWDVLNEAGLVGI